MNVKKRKPIRWEKVYVWNDWYTGWERIYIRTILWDKFPYIVIDPWFEDNYYSWQPFRTNKFQNIELNSKLTNKKVAHKK